MRRKELPKIPVEVVGVDGVLKIHYVNKLPPPKNSKEYTAGLYDGGTDEIFIIRREPRKEKWIIFFHELIHALESEGKITLTEKEVKALSNTLFRCFIRNDWKLPGEK